MILDLREVIGVPGLKLSFDFSPDLSGITDSQYISVDSSHAVGSVRNEAGALKFTADVDARIHTVCSRCLEEFDYQLSQKITAAISDSEEAAEDSELYYTADAKLDADELISTEILLSFSASPICKEDCRGLCPTCGKNLNEGECGCKPDIDPRLAALAALLD